MSQIDAIIEGYKAYSNNPEAEERIRLAYQIARDAHAGQFRKSGEPYIVHPLAVAQILVELKMDSACICAALLHDTIEDTDIELETIRQQLGREIAVMVDALTKIKTNALAEKIHKEQERADTMRKIVLGMAKNVRVIIVKLADRWNNVRTLQFMSLEKRKQIARETMAIYAPIADRLGLSIIRRDLEDQSFSHLDPKNYQTYQRRLATSKSFLENDINDLKLQAEEILARHGLKVRIYERFKTAFSLYQRALQKLPAHMLHLAVITTSDLSCYQALGILHENYRPLPGTTIKDYIAIPRTNGYQALHTYVLFRENVYPIQIRSEKMEQVAMYGILQSGNESSRSRYRTWIKRLKELVQDEADARDLMKGIEDLAAQDKIYVCTPQGDYLGFPRDAVVLDFAYRIHTDIGHRCQGALMDERPAGIFDKLVDGAMVEIIHSDEYQIRPDWLDNVRTPRSRTAIRNWIETRKRIRSREFGERLLNLELERQKIDLRNLIMQARFASILQDMNVADTDELFFKVGRGIITIKTAMKSLLDEEEYRKYTSRGTSQVSRLFSYFLSRPKVDDVFEITDIHDPYLKFSQCCNPLHGEEIVGILSIQHGLSVHRMDCPQLKTHQREDLQLIKLVWNTEDTRQSPITFRLVCNKKDGVPSTIFNTLESHEVIIRHFQLWPEETQILILVEVMSNSAQYSERIQSILQSIKGVEKVIRTQSFVKGKRP
ncbi:bifunctional (p)ppGpp synthetase/guanosine-3',5'-bis(diphosphate) 3'-pyrophosphohydrolase [bacterium]|nr:bifunctional (p)ppGpp synthetase/guanosine-3',5'-bis(diphosphate) 3'-pyrophosphohydrolase [candidate division CSSED10-310 bacterium]